jgi:uridylate kinase
LKVIVIGGGNIFRGVAGAKWLVWIVRSIYKGMLLVTVINGLALQNALLEDAGIKTRLQTVISTQRSCRAFIRRKANESTRKGRVCYFLVVVLRETLFYYRSCCCIKIIEIEADVILASTRVDGIYTADSEKDVQNAIKVGSYYI